MASGKAVKDEARESEDGKQGSVITSKCNREPWKVLKDCVMEEA